MPPLLLGPVGPKLDLTSEHLRDLKEHTPCLPRAPNILFNWYRLRLGRLFKTSPGISNVQPSLATAVLDHNHAVNLNFGVSFF